MEFQKIMNTSVRCSLLIVPPDINPCILTEGFKCRLKGYEMELLDVVRRKLHLNFTFVIPPDGQFGAIVNGTWNGVISQLINNVTTISCKPLTFTAVRSTVVDYSYPMKYVKQGFIIRNPGAKAAEFEFLKIIQWYICLLILATLGAFLILSILDQRIRKLKNKPVQESMKMFYQYITGGSNDDPDESWGLRVFTSTSLLMMGIIYTYFFTYILQASMIVKNVISFHNTKELASLIMSSDYRIIADSLSTAWYVEIYNSQVEDFRMMKKVLTLYPPLIETNQTRLLETIYYSKINYVYSHNLDILRKMVNGQCDKYLIVEDTTPYLSFASFVFPKGSPYKAAFSWALMGIHEFAEDTLKRRYYPFLPCDKVTNSLDDNAVVQTIIIKGAMYFPAFLGLSLVAFVVELVYFNWSLTVSVVSKLKLKMLTVFQKL